MALEIKDASGLHYVISPPPEVGVEPMWDKDLGFSVEVFAGGSSQIQTEGNLFEAIEH